MSGLGDKIAGKADELKGKAKAAAGDATDNPDLQAEGHGKQVVGEVKDAANDAIKH